VDGKVSVDSNFVFHQNEEYRRVALIEQKGFERMDGAAIGLYFSASIP
jgi:hypothetical protein